jgi:hypothetical protein
MKRKWHTLFVGLMVAGSAITASPEVYGSSYVVTAKPTLIECSNGNRVILNAFESTILLKEVSSETLLVRLPSPKFDQRCPRGKLSTWSVYSPFGTHGSAAEWDSRRSKRQRAEPQSGHHTKLSRGTEIIPELSIPEPFVESESAESMTEAFTNGELAYAPNSNASVLTTSRRANAFMLDLNRRNEALCSARMKSRCRGSGSKCYGVVARTESVCVQRLALKCKTNFLGAGSQGVWGEHAKDVLNRAFFTMTLANDDSAFSSICPAYRYLNVEQKKNLTVLALTAQAHWESRCDPKSANRGAPHGTAKGLTQLHQGMEHTYVSAQFKNYCPRNASNNPFQSINCTLAMFMIDLKQGQTIAGNQDSHWAVFRPKNAETRMTHFKAMFSQIPDCHLMSYASSRKSSPQNRGSQYARLTTIEEYEAIANTKANAMPIGDR